MLAVTKVQEAQRLLAEGRLSQRRIAALIGISRSTLSGIAAGTRPDYDALRRARGDDEEPLGPVERCPGCGGRVHMPCRLCRVRKIKHQEQQTRRVLRRQARQLALQRLLTAVREANQARDAADCSSPASASASRAG
jgi:transcriptional regulator with XRE-family HTH domain